MHKQTQPAISSASLPSTSQDSNEHEPSMACQEVAEDHLPPSDDFEFCVFSSGGLAPAGDDAAADMCVADEVFSGGKLLPLRRLSSAAASAGDAPSALQLLLLRSDSLDAAAASTASTTASSSGFSSRSVSRSTSSSSSASSSDHAGPGGGSSSGKHTRPASSAVPLPPRRSLSGSVFYAHPSPSPRPPPRASRSRTTAAARRSTGSAPPPLSSWGVNVIRLGVVGAPEVYAPRRPAEYTKAAAARSGSARFEPRHGTAADRKLAALGLLGAGLVCSCSPDAVAPVGSAEVAAAEARRRRRRKKAEEKKRSATAEHSGKGGTAWRSRILEWLEDLSISKEKSAAVSSSCR